MTTPTLTSLALRDIPAPDYADCIIIVIGEGTPTDPSLWARTIFSSDAMPAWVAWLMRLRQALVPLVGIRPAGRDAFDIREVVGDEALLSMTEPHLDCRIAVGVDTDARLVRLTTTVALKGRRGRLYFAPVRLLHPIVVDSMLRRAARRLSAS